MKVLSLIHHVGQQWVNVCRLLVYPSQAKTFWLVALNTVRHYYLTVRWWAVALIFFCFSYAVGLWAVAVMHASSFRKSSKFYIIFFIVLAIFSFLLRFITSFFHGSSLVPFCFWFFVVDQCYFYLLLLLLHLLDAGFHATLWVRAFKKAAVKYLYLLPFFIFAGALSMPLHVFFFYIQLDSQSTLTWLWWIVFETLVSNAVIMPLFVALLTNFYLKLSYESREFA